MDLATFTADTLDDLWRPNHPTLPTALPRLMLRAEGRLRRELRIQQDEVSLEAEITTDVYTLPADFDTIRSLQWVNRGPGRYTTPNDFSRAVKRPLYPGAINRLNNQVNDLEFTIEGTRLYHRQNAAPETPVPIRLVYFRKLPSLTNNDDTLYNEYPDVYRYAVYRECAIYLKSAEEIPMYGDLYKEALDTALADQNMKRYTEGPLKMQMPRRDVN